MNAKNQFLNLIHCHICNNNFISQKENKKVCENCKYVIFFWETGGCIQIHSANLLKDRIQIISYFDFNRTYVSIDLNLSNIPEKTTIKECIDYFIKCRMLR